MSPLPNLLALAGLGLLLGLRHAFEPDHLAAVSTLAMRQGRLLDACRLGLAWAVGHTASVGVVVGAIILFGLRLPDRLWPAADLLVAVLLIGLGGSVILRYARGRWHLHMHSHAGGSHLHLHSHAHGTAHEHAHPQSDARRSLGFGLLHGPAGSPGSSSARPCSCGWCGSHRSSSWAASTRSPRPVPCPSRRPRSTESGGRRSSAAPGWGVTSIASSGTKCRARATPVPPTRVSATGGGARRTRSTWRRAGCTTVRSPSTRCCTICCSGATTLPYSGRAGCKQTRRTDAADAQGRTGRSNRSTCRYSTYSPLCVCASSLCMSRLGPRLHSVHDRRRRERSEHVGHGAEHVGNAIESEQQLQAGEREPGGGERRHEAHDARRGNARHGERGEEHGGSRLKRASDPERDAVEPGHE